MKNTTYFSDMLYKLKNMKYMDTQPIQIQKESKFRIYNNSFISKFLSKFCNYYDKAVNPTYATFKGGYGSWNDDMTNWDYFCLWGHLRLCYNKTDLIDGWSHISLHGYRNGYTYTPVKKLLWNFNWHFAFNKKFPFIKIGFKNIWKLNNENSNWHLAFNKRPPVIKIRKFGN